MAHHMIKLSGITKKGRQRVKQHGEMWRVLEVRDTVIFSSERGPWMLVAPGGHDKTSNSIRWVHVSADEDFAVIP